MQRTAKKCTMGYNARAELLFCSLNLLFSDVRVAVAVVDILNSLMKDKLFRRIAVSGPKKFLDFPETAPLIADQL